MDILNFVEKDLETMICENAESMKSSGFIHFYKNIYRQMRLPLGGIVDIFTYEISGSTFSASVIELKRGIINSDAISQILKYGSEIHYLLSSKFKYNVDIGMYLVGSSRDENLYSETYFINNLYIYEYYFNINGLSFCENKESRHSDPKESTFEWGDWGNTFYENLINKPPK